MKKFLRHWQLRYISEGPSFQAQYNALHRGQESTDTAAVHHNVE
jgi:hypothetical protein